MMKSNENPIQKAILGLFQRNEFLAKVVYGHIHFNYVMLGKVG